MTLGAFSPLNYGKALPERSRELGQFNVYSSAGHIGYHNASLCHRPGIVIGRKGTVGSVTLARGPFWAIDTAFYVADEPERRDLLFTYHLLGQLGLDKMNSDSAVPDLNRENAHALEICVPPLWEQREIGATLGALDEKIELNRKMAATLEERARALYRSWFVNFDPVHARAEGRAPVHLDPATAALFPDSFGEDGLPTGWNMERIGDLLTLNYGKALRKDQRRPGAFPVYGSGDSDSTHEFALVREPTIIVGRKGTVGSIRWAPDGCWPIDTVFYVTTKFPMPFILRSLQELPLTDMNTDAAVPGLNRDNVYRLKTAWAGPEVANAFGVIAGSYERRIDALDAENRTLAALRDTLLPCLMSGEIRVGTARELVEEVA